MRSNSSDSGRKRPTLIVLGSGGHTAEMSQIAAAVLSKDNEHSHLYAPVRCIIAKTDCTSRDKFIMEMSAAGVHVDVQRDFVLAPRSREVGQSWLSTVFTTLWAMLWSFWHIWQTKPELLLCNGPGTCVPFCYAVVVCRLLRRIPRSSKVVFIESYCRVSSLSLSGRLLLNVADMFVVHWPALAEKYKHRKNVHYFGRIL